MNPIQAWRDDPEFQALPDEERARIAINYFDKKLADDTFLALPEPEQQRIKLNFLHKSDLAIPPDMVETSISVPVSPPWKVRKAIPQGGEMFDLVRNGIDARTGKPVPSPVAELSKQEEAARTRREVMGFPAGGLPPAQDPMGQFIYNMFDVAALGVPSALRIGPEAEPETTGAKIGKGAGQLAGFVAGLPGMTYKQVLRGVLKAAPELAAKGPLAHEMARGMLRESLPLTAAVISEQLGALIKEPERAEEILKDAALVGESLGVGFGAAAPPAARIIAKVADKMKALWARATVKERGLVVQGLEETLKKNPNTSEAELVRMSQQYFEEALARRVVPETPPSRPISPEAGPVVKPQQKAPSFYPPQPFQANGAGTIAPKPAGEAARFRVDQDTGEISDISFVEGPPEMPERPKRELPSGPVIELGPPQPQPIVEGPQPPQSDISREKEYEARVTKLKAEMASLGEQVRRAKKKFQATNAERRMTEIANEIDQILKEEFPDLIKKWSQSQRDYLDRLKEIGKRGTTKPSEAQATPAPTAPEAQVPLEHRIRGAYNTVSGGKKNVRVLLSDLRKELPDVPRETLDAELLRMQREGRGVTLMRLDDPQQRTKEIEAAALDIIGEKRHLVYMEGGGQQAPQTKRPEDAESGIKPEEPTERPIPKTFREEQTGNKATVFTPRNNPLDVQYGVIEADDLIVSHDLMGRPNPAYPEEIQPRDRSRTMSELQINGIRQKMVVEHPELLGDMADTDRGGPLIGEDLVVEGGNGRTLAIQSAYQRGEADAYRDMIKRRAEALGINPALVDKMKKPVLVRIRKSEVADRAELARELNESGAARMSPAEQARMDAARLKDEDLFSLNPDESGSLTAASNRGFIKHFLERMGSSERSGMLDSDGRPTRQLVDRMQAAVFDKVYKDPRLISLMAEDVNPGIKNILNALTKVAPRFITAFRGGEPNALKQMDITPHIADAVNLVLEARNRQVDSVDMLLRQQTLFESQHDPTAEALSRFFDEHKRSAKALTIGLESMAGQIQKEGRRALNKNLFGETPVKTTAQIVKQAQADVQKAYEKPDQGDLFSKTGPIERKVTAEDEDFIKLYAGVPIPEMISETKKAFASGIIDEDISKRLEGTAIPFWLAKNEPVFAKYYKNQEKRDYNRNMIRHMYTKMARPAFALKDKQSVKKVGILLARTDATHKIYSEDELTRLGLSPAERQAYLAAREAYDTIWYEDLPDLMNGLGFSESEIEQFRRSVGNVKGYMAHLRKGRWFVRIKQDKEILWREHFDDILGTLTRGKYLWKAPLKKADLKKLGGQIEFGENKRVPEDIFFNVSPRITEELIDLALEKSGMHQTAKDVFKRALTSAIADMFKARGFMAHGMKRRGIPGYETNWQETLLEYIGSWAGFKSKLLAAEEIKGMWGKDYKTWKKKPNLRAYTDKYIRDAFVNTDQYDRAIDKSRAFFFYKYLGGIVKSAALNLTQNYVTVIPRLSIETKWSSVRLHHEMMRTLKDVIEVARIKPGPDQTRYEAAIAKRLPWQKLAGLTRAMNTGVVSDKLTQELMAINLGKYGDDLRHVSDGLRFMFGKTEMFDRITTWLTAFDIAYKEKNMRLELAWDWADSIVEETHFDYGKSNLPPFIRGKVGRFLRPFYTFRTYTDQLVRGVWHDFLTNKDYGPIKGKIAFMKSVLALMFFGGLGGFPLYKSIEALITKLTGKNVGSEVAKNAGDYAEYLLYGAPALFGVDLTGSISIEVPTSIEDVLGIPASLVRDSVNTYKDLKGGDYYRAVEDFPLNFQVVSNAMKANRMTDRGQQTRTGKVIFDDEGEPIKMTGVEAAEKILGFQPTRISEGYRKYRARQDVLDYWQAKKDGLSAKYVLARQNKGPRSEEAREAYKNIVEFNKSRPKFVAPIDFRRIIRSRTMDRPSRREQLLLREVQ